MSGDVSDPLVGEVLLGRYRVSRFLAKGGMGAIYLARNEGAAGFVRPVVIKRILPDLIGDELTAKLFAREARIMSNLRHPGIVSVLEFAYEGGAYIMVLEYVHGFHLGRWYRFVKRSGSHFPVQLAVHIVISVLDALHYAHTLKGSDGKELNIIHRDIKPSNILIDVDGHVKLADFGVARMQTERTEASSQSTIKGTFSYLAPEILQGGEPAASTDLYSCGVLLHELLTGRNEFSHKDMRTIVARVLDHVPTPVDQIRKSATPELRDAIAKSLAKSPQHRYADAAEFAKALRAVRELSTEEAAEQLAQKANRDFHDPLIARLLQTDDLSALERSWRTPASAVKRVPDSVGNKPAPDAPTVVDRAQNLSPGAAVPRPAPKARAWGLPLLVAGAVVLLAGGWLVWTRQPGQPQYNIVVEGGHVSPDDPTRPETDAGARAGGVGSFDATVMARGSADAASAKSGDSGHGESKPPRPPTINESFRKKQGAVKDCIDRYAQSAQGAPEISLRFRLAKSGQILATDLSPDAITSTPLGTCLLRVAKTTEFAPQASELKFSIPITISKK